MTNKPDYEAVLPVLDQWAGYQNAKEIIRQALKICAGQDDTFVVVRREPSGKQIETGTNTLLLPKLTTGLPLGSEMAEAIAVYKAMISEE